MEEESRNDHECTHNDCARQDSNWALTSDYCGGHVIREYKTKTYVARGLDLHDGMEEENCVLSHVDRDQRSELSSFSAYCSYESEISPSRWAAVSKQSRKVCACTYHTVTQTFEGDTEKQNLCPSDVNSETQTFSYSRCYRLTETSSTAICEENSRSWRMKSACLSARTRGDLGHLASVTLQVVSFKTQESQLRAQGITTSLKQP